MGGKHKRSSPVGVDQTQLPSRGEQHTGTVRKCLSTGMVGAGAAIPNSGVTDIDLAVFGHAGFMKRTELRASSRGMRIARKRMERAHVQMYWQLWTAHTYDRSCRINQETQFLNDPSTRATGLGTMTEWRVFGSWLTISTRFTVPVTQRHWEPFGAIWCPQKIASQRHYVCMEPCRAHNGGARHHLRGTAELQRVPPPVAGQFVRPWTPAASETGR